MLRLGESSKRDPLKWFHFRIMRHETCDVADLCAVSWASSDLPASLCKIAACPWMCWVVRPRCVGVDVLLAGCHSP
jgi:hypothetical protein